MFKNKLTTQQALQIFAALQFVLGIIGYFTVKKTVRSQFLITYFILGILIFIASLVKTNSKSSIDKQNETSSTEKYDQILGIATICIGLLNFILGQNIGLTLVFLDGGIVFLIMPPN